MGRRGDDIAQIVIGSREDRRRVRALAASPRRPISTKVFNRDMATIVAHRGEGSERPGEEEAVPTFVESPQHSLSSSPNGPPPGSSPPVP
jgi:hypothetical protein